MLIHLDKVMILFMKIVWLMLVVINTYLELDSYDSGTLPNF